MPLYEYTTFRVYFEIEKHFYGHVDCNVELFLAENESNSSWKKPNNSNSNKTKTITTLHIDNIRHT